MLKAIRDVINERCRQIDQEGFSHDHDDQHDPGELCAAAGSYAVNAACELYPLNMGVLPEQPVAWCWDMSWWKPKSPRQDLVRAAALIIAEIERIDRAEASDARD